MLSWQDSIDKLKGVGQIRSDFLKSQGIATIGDLLMRAPLRFIDRTQANTLADLVPPPKGEVTAIGEVQSLGTRGHYRKQRFMVIIGDGKGFLTGVWFKTFRGLKEKFQPGQKVAFTGRVSFYDGPQMSHPRVTFLTEDSDAILEKGMHPVYPSGAEWERVGLGKRGFSLLIQSALKEWDGKGPYLPDEIVKQQSLVPLSEAIRSLHLPESTEQYENALHSLKFNELFVHQTLMVALRRRRRAEISPAINDKLSLLSKFRDSLPFILSASQETVLDEIRSDIHSGTPMYRLLQGEVGSGKTIVALSAATIAAGSGFQTAFMAPTELLARQHYKNALKWCEPIGIKTVLWTAGLSTESLESVKFEAATGEAQLIIGTHSLIQEKARFHNLGLVIIDEQHRFGVRQRSRLVGKGTRPHVLLMTATPIPRSLALAHFGDMDISLLDPLPDFKRSVTTKVVNEAKRDEVFRWLRGKLLKGHRGYLVFAVIEESSQGLEAASQRFEPYQKIDFKGIPMALMHGKMPVEDRIRAMEDFRSGKISLLAATAVIEVGVDVPEASIIVVENAERFGLAQLHQLRGRVGRSGKKGVCVLITREMSDDHGFERLRKLETSDNGLELAEEDLRLRGAGEPLGARQSGMASFKLADLGTDTKLLYQAHKSAEYILDKYPDLAPFQELRTKLRQEYRKRPKTMYAG